MTNMNLRNIRKSREYQCLLIDLVKTNVIGKSAAEGLLGYTIPAGLLGSTTPATPDDDDEEEPGSGGESGGEGSGGESDKITLVYFDYDESTQQNLWRTSEYTLTGEDTWADIINAGNQAFGLSNVYDPEGTIPDTCYFVTPDAEYEEDDVNYYKYVNPQPESFEDGQMIMFYSSYMGS